MKNKGQLAAVMEITASMLIFGTIGIVRRYIPLPSSVIALVRGIVGSLFILVIFAVKKQKLDIKAIKRNFALLAFSGAFIGINWILLFEAYNYTTIPIATLCNYMSPVMVVLASPLAVREKLTPKKLICIAAATVGMLLSSGIIGGDGGGNDNIKGAFFALGAAVLYASAVLMNKKLKDIGAYDRTVVQLGSAAVVMFPYVLLTEHIEFSEIEPKTLIFLGIAGIVHTGVAYVLYFGSMRKLSAQSAAIFSYIDPVTALIVAPIFFRDEVLTPVAVVGAVLIIASAIICELPENTHVHFRKVAK